MALQCPNCSAKLGFMAFLLPKTADFRYRCNGCGAQISFTGVFSWGIEIALLLLSYAIYRLVEGNFVESLIAAPLALLAVGAQYYFAPIRATKS